MIQKIGKLSPFTVGIVQTGLLVLYVTLIAWIGLDSQGWMGPIGKLGPIMSIAIFLLLLVASVLISGLMTLGYPAMLFLSGHHKRALAVIFWNALWIAAFIIFVVAYVVILSSQASS